MSALIRIVRMGIAVSFGLIVLISGTPAQAYIDQNPYDVSLTGPGHTVACNGNAVINASVKSATNGHPVPLQGVIWDIKSGQSSGDRLSDHKTSTGADGTTSVTLAFGPEAGARVVRATIATWPATITVKCSGASGASPTPLPTPHPTPRPTQEPPGPTPEPTASPLRSQEPAGPTPVPTASPLRSQEPAGPTPVPSASPLPGTDASIPRQAGQVPEIWLLLVVVLVGAAALLLLRRRSRS